MATLRKRKRRKRAPRPKRLGVVFIRLSDEEEAAFRSEAGREPLASWARRVLWEHVEGRARGEKR